MSIQVKDAAGATVTIGTIDDLIEIVGTASGQAAIVAAIQALSGDLPVGSATETTLAAILAKLIATPSTAANQATIIGHVDGIEAALAALNAKDFATQTTLAAILAKLIAAPATESGQTTLIGHVDGIEGSLTSINAKDFATQATLAAVLAKLIAAPATEAKQDALIALVDGVEGSLTSLNAKDFGTQATLAAILAKIIAAPATEAKQDSEIAAVNRIGTRAYGTVERIAVGSTAGQSSAITATEVLLHASTKCFVLAGSGTPAPTSSTGIPLEAGEKFHMRITSGHKIGVIRDAADGFLHIAPVV